jgi:hypothetical protein
VQASTSFRRRSRLNPLPSYFIQQSALACRRLIGAAAAGELAPAAVAAGVARVVAAAWLSWAPPLAQPQSAAAHARTTAKRGALGRHRIGAAFLIDSGFGAKAARRA